MVGYQDEIKRSKFTYWMSAPHATHGKQSILLIHGFGGTYSGLEGLSELLAEHHNILGLDLPGYGLSEPLKRKHTLKNYAHFLDDFCATTEFHKITVVGHSFGADIAIMFAAMHPDKVEKLVLVSPVLFGRKNVAQLGRFYYSFVAKMPPRIRHRLLHNHALTWLSTMSNFKQADKQTRAKVLRDDYVNDHLMTDRPIIESYFSLLSTPFFKTASQITVPTLILAGDDDMLSPVDEMERLHNVIPDSKLQIIKASGHFLPIEEPKKVHDKINTFLKKPNK